MSSLSGGGGGGGAAIGGHLEAMALTRHALTFRQLTVCVLMTCAKGLILKKLVKL